jgi:hypothetical protein
VSLLKRDGPAMRVAPCFKQTGVLLVCAALAWWTQAGGLPAKLGVAVAFVALCAALGTITLADLSFLVPFGTNLGRARPQTTERPKA